ncbi:MAG: hypothetical protein J5I90_20560 [Caldilineales bacterium]|nr:hypothetical protein [Caldilineales bacterium]
MSRSTLRILIIIFTLITAAIHLLLGFNFFADTLGKLFVLNGLGYVILLAALLVDFPQRPKPPGAPSPDRIRRRHDRWVLCGQPDRRQRVGPDHESG